MLFFFRNQIAPMQSRMLIVLVAQFRFNNGGSNISFFVVVINGYGGPDESQRNAYFM